MQSHFQCNRITKKVDSTRLKRIGTRGHLPIFKSLQIKIVTRLGLNTSQCSKESGKEHIAIVWDMQGFRKRLYYLIVRNLFRKKGFQLFSHTFMGKQYVVGEQEQLINKHLKINQQNFVMTH